MSGARSCGWCCLCLVTLIVSGHCFSGEDQRQIRSISSTGQPGSLSLPDQLGLRWDTREPPLDGQRNLRKAQCQEREVEVLSKLLDHLEYAEALPDSAVERSVLQLLSLSTPQCPFIPISSSTALLNSPDPHHQTFPNKRHCSSRDKELHPHQNTLQNCDSWI